MSEQLVARLEPLVQSLTDAHDVTVREEVPRTGFIIVRWKYTARGANRTDVLKVLETLAPVSSYLRDLDEGSIFLPARGKAERLCTCTRGMHWCEDPAVLAEVEATNGRRLG
jgi:hypothetical protein